MPGRAHALAQHALERRGVVRREQRCHLRAQGRVVPAFAVEQRVTIRRGNVERAMEQVRGRRIATIFQNPRASLDPSFTVQSQLIETLRRSGDLTPVLILSALAQVDDPALRHSSASNVAP